MSQIFKDPQFVRKVKRLDNVLADVRQRLNHKVQQSQAMNSFKQKFKKHQPKNLMGGELKPYQHQALVWMIQLAYREMNGILADDMGLGKTIQTISYLAYLKQEHEIKGKHIIIAPLTVLKNWERQIKKWLPSLKVVILWATQAERQQTLRTVVRTRDFDILLTSYQGATYAVGTLKKLTWETMTIDQAHKIKNDEAMVTEAVKRYNANFKLLLTGTPLNNNLCELWSLLNFVMPDIFYDKSIFLEVQQGVKLSGMSQKEQFEAQCEIAKRFHGIIKPFMLRRTKQNTDLGLPPKTIKTLFVAMTKLQLKMYKNFLKYKSVFGKDGPQQINGQMATRKICNHPYLYSGIEPQDSPQFGDHIIESGGKMLVLDKLLKKLVGQQKKKVLIFSQFKIQLNILQDYCTYRNYNYLRLDGESSIQQRQEMMENFNNDKNFQIPIFMLSTRAGGLGVNLVAASIVIIFDIDWNPQSDNQAMDRAYRIGQVNPVHVFKMVTEHTIEERMLEVQKYKLVLDELVIQKGTVINLKNQDILAGLNYEKIVHMKKGDVFKLEAHQDNRTIEQIIAMGEIKDQEKLEEIKKKIQKQIQAQKNRQGAFNANPFDQNQLLDKQGNDILKHYQGYKVGNNINTVTNRDIKKNKQIVISVPFYHLYADVNSFIQKSKMIIKLKRELENDQNNQQKQKIQELNNLQKQLQEMNQRAHANWTLAEFKSFMKVQRESTCPTQDNIEQLKKQIPHKSKRQLKAYKADFYKYQSTNFIFKREMSSILKSQQLNNVQRKKQIYMKSLQQSQITYYKRNEGPLLNHLNNLRIKSGQVLKRDFLETQLFKNDKITNFLGSFVNFQHSLALQKNKLTNIGEFQNKFRIKIGTEDNPKVDKEKNQQKYQQTKLSILTNLRKRYLQGQSNQQTQQQQKIIQNSNEVEI